MPALDKETVGLKEGCESNGSVTQRWLGPVGRRHGGEAGGTPCEEQSEGHLRASSAHQIGQNPARV
jgi:hypothetical protein